MARPVQVRLAAPPDEVRESVDRVLADTPRAVTTVDVDVRADGAGSVVILSSRMAVRVPYFGWFVRILTGVAARRERADLARRVRAAVETGEVAPPSRRRWSVLPAVSFTAEQAASLGTVAAVGVVANFGGSLFTQDGDAVARSFGRSDQDLGFALALTRAGVLVALVAAAAADRFGRRRMVLVGLGGIAVANALAAVAPTFEVFTVSQVLTRALVNSTLVVAAIVAVEEAPEGARAFALSMFGLALGLGFGVSVMLLPVADLGSDAWRFSFAVSALIVLALPSLARNLSETGRFDRLAEHRGRRGRRRWRELWAPPYGRRFLALGAVAFFVNVFSAPSSQLTNRYLTHTHHFSNSGVAVFRSVTAGVPGVVGVLLAGRWAETWGRRPVSIVGLALATVAQMVFFLTAGVVLWATAVVSIVAAASAGLTVGALDAELFPTEVRGTSNGFLLVCGVAGSAVGLLAATTLESAVGGLGPAIAVCGVASLLAAVVFLPLLPETAARPLDDVSPSGG
ncbi:MAG TPA: MFS transporter [Acidimicrobiia bacterium]|nr:MFS transporter [Acidimicrobiia bacterium]